MPPKLRAAVRSSLVSSSLAAEKGGRKGGIVFCPSCSTCRKRTLSTVAITPASTATLTSTSCRTRNAGCSSSSSSSKNNSVSKEFFGNGSSVSATVRRYLSSSISSNGTVGIGGVGVDNISSSSSSRKSSNVPPHLRELYAALHEIQQVAADHVSLSRLQLAQRGLESEDPVIRVAVLGVNDVRATRRLVRLLLADPLSEKQPWEDLVDVYGIEESNGLLIRYGQESEIVENSPCPTISVTSPALRRGSIEIFVGTLENAGSVTDEAFFVPTITIPTSESGGEHGQHKETIRYPVHRSIVCGSGTDGLLAYASLLGRANLNASEQLAVHGVIELTSAKPEDNGGSGGDNAAVTLVNTDRAEAALAKFRESVHFASDYERGWSASGVQSVADQWLSLTPAKTPALGPDLQTLVHSLLDTAESKVTADEAARIKEQEMTSASAVTRQRLDESVSAWAERAHTELRNALDEGFASRRWKALSWWKLFWRVDDVGSVMAEILQTRYLPRAEKEMIWTAGRVKQAGLLDGTDDLTEASTKENESSENHHPWPLKIATSRLEMLGTTIPSLQSLSQGLVLFSASTVGLTSTLSALLYTSASTGLYEACTIAAVGLIYCMRRQQIKWEKARSSWEAEVRERGRIALVETEELLRTLIRDGPVLRSEDSAETPARRAVTRARRALEEVRGK